MTEITRAPDPIKPLRGRGINYLVADASKWVNVPQAPLWQVVALSLGIEPYSLNMARREFCPPVFRDRFDVAWANRGHGLPDFEHGGSAVGMKAFGDWALGLAQPLSLPEWFPRTRPGDAPAKRKRASSGATAGRLEDAGALAEKANTGIPARTLNDARWAHLPALKAKAFELATSELYEDRSKAARAVADRPLDDKGTYCPERTINKWLKEMDWSPEKCKRAAD